jgi:hypothetical protein
VPTNDETGCVCAECGHEQPTMDPCAKCRSVRVVLIRVIRDLFGADWRENFEPEEALVEGEGR